MPSKARLEFIDSGNTAELVVYGRIGVPEWYDDGVNAKKIVSQLAASEARTIQVRINSGGGSAFDGIAIYNALKRHSARIEVTIDGQAGSAASIIAMAADQLTMPRGSFLWIHNAWTYAGGESKDLRKVADQLDQLNGEVVNIYTDKCKLSYEDVKKQMEAETWFSPADAKANGYADVIDEDVEIDAYASGNTAFFAGVGMPRNFVPDHIFNSLRAEASNRPKPPEPRQEKRMNLDELKAAHPELYASIVAGATSAAESAAKATAEAARLEGAKAERERIASIEQAAVPGYEELVAKAKADPAMSGKDLAWDITQEIKAKGGNYLKNRNADAADVGDAGAAPNAEAHQPVANSKAAEINQMIAAMAADIAGETVEK